MNPNKVYRCPECGGHMTATVTVSLDYHFKVKGKNVKLLKTGIVSNPLNCFHEIIRIGCMGCELEFNSDHLESAENKFGSYLTNRENANYLANKMIKQGEKL